MATDRTGQEFQAIFPALVQIDGNVLADSEGTEYLNVNSPAFGGDVEINRRLLWDTGLSDLALAIQRDTATAQTGLWLEPQSGGEFYLGINQNTSPSSELDVNGDAEISGSLSKGSGTFLIDHPLNPTEKDLYHGFVEAPRYDLIYRGRVSLTNGTAEVDIDSASGMAGGTFDALTKNATVTSLQNQDGFSRVKPTDIVDGKFTIECEDSVSDEISWVVIAERDDDFIKNHDSRTNDTGSLVPEWDKEAPEEVQVDSRKTTAIRNNRGKKGYPRHPKAHGLNEDELFSDEDEYQESLNE